MKRLPRLPKFIPLIGAVAVSLVGLTSCGDSGPTCGAGTMEVNGTCVPDVTCGDGTHAEGGHCVADSQCGTGTKEDPGTHECVPDGSVICPQGTTFQDGQCNPDITACAAGTVLVDGQCRPEDETLHADVNEAAEPNDDAASPAGTIVVGAVDSSTVIHGCVNPRADADGDGNPDADFDVWMVNATAPVTLEITADGVHGLVAGFVMVNGDPTLSPALDNWRRFGINLTSDTAKRQVYLPAAGTYALLMTDARSLVLGQAGAGAPDACYYTTVKRVATPAPVPLTVPQTVAMDAGQVKLYSFTAPTDGRILDVTLNTESSVMSPAFLVLRGPQNGLYASARYDGTDPALYSVGGLDMNEQVILVSDMEYDWALAPQAYTYDLVDINAQQLPANGSVTLTKHNGLTPLAPYADWNYLYFDVATAGTILNFTVTGSNTATPPGALSLDMAITRRDVFNAGDVVALIDAFGGSGRSGGFNNEFVRFDRPGRYYFIVQDPTGTSGDMFTLTSSYASAPVTAMTYGTPLANQALPANRSAFHSLDLTNPLWVQFGLTGTGFPSGSSGARLSFYDLTGSGWLTTSSGNYNPAFTIDLNADGTTPKGRIMAHDTKDYLVRVQPSGTPGASPMYTLDVRDRDAYNFQTIAAGTAIDRTGMDLVAAATGTSQAAYGRKRFIVFGATSNVLTALVTPQNALADIQIQRLNADESNNGSAINAGGVNAAETLGASFAAAPADWVAFEVQNRTQLQTTDLTLHLTAVMPRPYGSAMGAIAFADVCPPAGTPVGMAVNGSTLLGTDLDDDRIAARALPAGWAFQYFGDPVTKYIIGANGWMKMGNDSIVDQTCSFGAYSNLSIPTNDCLNGVIAPFWNDYDTITLCEKVEPTMVTIQWTGNEYLSSPTVAFQVRLHMNGVIDFVYGSGAAHTSSGASATIGLENLSGSFGHQYSKDTAIVTANTSRVMTPM